MATISLPTALESLTQITVLLRDNDKGYYDDAADTYNSILAMHLQMMSTASQRGLDPSLRFYLAACWLKTRLKLPVCCRSAVRRVDSMLHDRGWNWSLHDLVRLQSLEREVSEEWVKRDSGKA